MMAPITSQIAEFAAGARYEMLPSETVRLAKQSLLDTLGITIAGSAEDAPSILSRFVQQDAGLPMSSVVGKGFKASARNAAMVNGTSGDVMGFSDLSTVHMHHPSVPVCAAIWAIAESRACSGKDVIAAHALGVEVSNKISAAIKPGFQKKGWHPIAVLGTFGAAIAVGKLLRLDAKRMNNAMGIAAQEASGIRVSMGTMSKAFGAGRGAENGVVAATLAELGFTGPTNALEGRNGFLQTFGDGTDGDDIPSQLGRPFEFESPGITLKRYPTCMRSHNAIQATLELQRKHNFLPEDIVAVECKVTQAVADLLTYPHPQNRFEAKYSLQYCIALALSEGEVIARSVTDASCHDRRILSLMNKVTMTVPEEFARLGYNPDESPFASVVQIKLDNGQSYTNRVDRSAWEPASNVPWDELLEKYNGCASIVLPSTNVVRAAEIVQHLEREESLKELMDLVRG